MALAPTGFWSYTRSDDTHSSGRLSRLRQRVASELQQLIGRRQPVRIFQDVDAIPYGTDWLKEINRALDQSSFLIPIVTPAFLESEACCEEVMVFHRRQQSLGRDDLIFPFHYIDVAHIHPSEVHDPAVLDLLKSRERFDFHKLRHRDFGSTEVLETLSSLAEGIRDALRRDVAPPPAPPVSPAVAAPPSAAPAVIVPASLAPPKPGDVMREGPGPEMVLIPAGRFRMGVPSAETLREGGEDIDKYARPLHDVTITHPFWLGKYPVTWAEYAAFVDETGERPVGDGVYGWIDGTWRQSKDLSWRRPGFERKLEPERHPVVCVSREDALAYIAWLSERTRQTYRLASEAEWEYAARAGTTTARYWSDKAGEPGEHAHFGARDGTRPVGSFKPNPFGLYDMLGNVWEWTADHWHEDYKGAPADGSAWTTGGDATRVFRGGSWHGEARLVRSAYRVGGEPEDRNNNLGFRCALVQV